MSDAGKYTSGPDAVTIATIPLQHEHDLIVLRRRLRSAADELNFDGRDMGRLSTAVYEAARQLYGARGMATAELRVTRAVRPSVRVIRPDVVGYSLVRKIRAVRDVPVVALTAFTQPEDRRRALRAGFRHFVPKPVEIDELAAVVRTVVHQG